MDQLWQSKLFREKQYDYEKCNFRNFSENHRDGFSEFFETVTLSYKKVP